MSQDSGLSNHGWAYGVSGVVVALVFYLVTIFLSSFLNSDARLVLLTTGGLVAMIVLAIFRKRMRPGAFQLDPVEIGPLSLLYVSLGSAGLVTSVTVAATSAVMSGSIPLSSPAERLFLLIAFIATAIPFYHGALTHLHRTSMSANRSTMMDFLVLMFEASVLLLLASSASTPLTFVGWLSLLLAIDCVWLVAALKGGRADSAPSVWLYLNTIVLFFLVSSWYLSLISIDITFLFAVALISIFRSVVDYTVAWTHYFPLVERKPM